MSALLNSAPKKIEISRYALSPKGSLGVSGKSSREGVLLRVTWNEHEIGYSDLHPWSELGDSPLEDQLKALHEAIDQSSGMDTLDLQTQHTLFFSKKEAEMRYRKISAWQEFESPWNHAFSGNLENCTAEQIHRAATQGFHSMKLKATSPDAEAFLRLAPTFSAEGIKLRLDFNQRLKTSEFDLFLREIQTQLEILDFIEDPTAFDPFEWIRWQQKYPLRLALDRTLQNFDWNDPALKVIKPFSVLIVKPAVQDAWQSAKNALAIDIPIVVTSYLDHPIGQLSAAWTASELIKLAAAGKGAQLLECGLLSHEAYELPEPLWLNSSESKLLPPRDGFGWGMDTYLSGLNWELLGK